MIFWIGEDRNGFSKSLIAQRNLVCGRKEGRKTKTKSDPGKITLVVLVVGMNGFEPAATLHPKQWVALIVNWETFRFRSLCPGDFVLEYFWGEPIKSFFTYLCKRIHQVINGRAFLRWV